MIDLNELERGLQSMKPRSRLYELVKAELQRRGHWKNKPRGAAFKPGQDGRRQLRIVPGSGKRRNAGN